MSLTKGGKIDLRLVLTKKDWNEFIELPWSIYKGDPHWVPPLRMAVRDVLNVEKNPFFRHAYMHPVLAYQGDKLVGRVVGVVDESNNTYHEEKCAFFGFFECIDDQTVANALLDEVARWAQSKGMTTVRGPMNPSTNHECGLLVEGFNDSPAVMMTYNPQYYLTLLENYGFKKAKDLYAYEINSARKFSEKLLAQAERLRQNAQIKFRPVRMKDFDAEIDRIIDIYNDAWEKNWGFVPMAPEEFRHMAKDMKAIVDPELLLIAEVRGEAVGFGLALPDVNMAIKRVKNGKLFPTGIFKLLWFLKGPGRKKTSRCRIVTLGIKKAYRELGLGPLFYAEYFKRGPAQGYPAGEASWILEDNIAMNRAAEHMAGKRTKAYRIFEKSLV
jgi:hypothetical protein